MYIHTRILYVHGKYPSLCSILAEQLHAVMNCSGASIQIRYDKLGSYGALAR